MLRCRLRLYHFGILVVGVRRWDKGVHIIGSIRQKVALRYRSVRSVRPLARGGIGRCCACGYAVFLASHRGVGEPIFGNIADCGRRCRACAGLVNRKRNGGFFRSNPGHAARYVCLCLIGTRILGRAFKRFARIIIIGNRYIAYRAFGG